MLAQAVTSTEGIGWVEGDRFVDRAIANHSKMGSIIDPTSFDHHLVVPNSVQPSDIPKLSTTLQNYFKGIHENIEVVSILDYSGQQVVGFVSPNQQSFRAREILIGHLPEINNVLKDSMLPKIRDIPLPRIH